MNFNFSSLDVSLIVFVKEKDEPKTSMTSSNLSILAGLCSTLSVSGYFSFNNFKAFPTAEPNLVI